jgi:hypothetical protein
VGPSVCVIFQKEQDDAGPLGAAGLSSEQVCDKATAKDAAVRRQAIRESTRNKFMMMSVGTRYDR